MKRIVIGITGASGAIYGLRLLEALHGKAQTHLVITDTASEIIRMEIGIDISEIVRNADHFYNIRDFSAPFASGSNPFEGMVIIPCSIKTLSAIANCYADTLLTRAADVMLKERRKLIVGVRETPFTAGHLRLMSMVTEMGGIICPPIPAFYSNPQTVGQVVDFSVGRILDLLDVDHNLYKRWDGISSQDAFESQVGECVSAALQNNRGPESC